MKKLFFIAAIASAALVSCTKNEVNEPAAQQEITFTAPIVGHLTKAQTGEVGTSYNKDEQFKVYAWYCEEEAFNPDNAQLYMNAITVTHDATINAGSDDGTEGAWKPVTTYYWPKNGKLTFSAYSPADAANHTTGIECDAKTGLSISSFTVQAAPADQYDLLYSDRAYNKTSSFGEVNAMYDGVDLQFRHALSSIHVYVKTDMTYPDGTITVNKVELQNVYKSGDFKESLVSGTEAESATTANWVGQHNSGTIVLGSTDQPVVYDKAKYGTTSMLIPQAFNHNADGITTLYVEYTIKNGDGTTLGQRASFKLNEYAGKLNGADTGLISQWVKGYRYIYTLTIGVNQVYFAPAVEDWKNIDVAFPQI